MKLYGKKFRIVNIKFIFLIKIVKKIYDLYYAFFVSFNYGSVEHIHENYNGEIQNDYYKEYYK